MSTLKQELQRIVDENLLNMSCEFICNNLCLENETKLQNFKEMASIYAKDYWEGDYSWWSYSYKDRDYVISEKYRFIKDLIKTL